MKKLFLLSISCILSLGLLSSSLQAQSGLPVASPVQPSPAAATSTSAAQSPSTSDSTTQSSSAAPAPQITAERNILIGPGDLLDVTVFDTPELSRSGRVAGDGTINLPLLGNVLVQGMTEAQAAGVINEQFLRKGLLLHPQTSVLIREFAMRGVTVLGEVNHAGIYPVAGPRSLLDVLALAGGFTNFADTRVTIERQDGKVEHVVESLPLDNAEVTISHDVQINPGDRVIAARAGMVYILGELNKPGGYAMQYNGTITVLQAVAWAGGATHFASNTHAYLLRREGASYTTKDVSLRDLMEGKTADFALQANDVLYVPFSNVKNFIVSAPQIIGSLGSAAIYGVNANR